MLTTDVRCRIDAKTKTAASEVIEAMGLNISDAIRLFTKLKKYKSLEAMHKGLSTK